MMTIPASGGAGAERKRVLVVDTDLFFVTRIVETLRHAGYEARAVRDLVALTQALEDGQTGAVLVNLAARGVDWNSAITAAHAAGIPIVAYGPHVDMALHEAARQAGADRVIANSKLAGDLSAIMARVVRSGEPAHAKNTNMANGGAAPETDDS
jgi:CheY-like chemotaxis protein